MASERIDPADYPGEPITLEHYARYAFVRQFVAGKRVLDVACGLGYGADYLRACGAGFVLGVDMSREAIEDARRRYAAPNLQFEIGDAHALQAVAPGPWDVVASFETIEHLTDPSAFIEQCSAVLRGDGLFVASVPNDVHDPPGSNEFHIQHFERNAFEHLLRAAFDWVQIVPQYFVLASVVDASKQTSIGPLMTSGSTDSASPTPGAAEPECFIALCARTAPPQTVSSVLVHARRFWEYHLEVEQAKQWLHDQRENFVDTTARLSAELTQARQTIDESVQARGWLEEQRSRWEGEAVRLAAELNAVRLQLEQAKHRVEAIENVEPSTQSGGRDPESQH